MKRIRIDKDWKTICGHWPIYGTLTSDLEYPTDLVFGKCARCRKWVEVIHVTLLKDK